jgi:hypothetical protein
MKKFFFSLSLYSLFMSTAFAQPGALLLGTLMDVPVAKTSAVGSVETGLRLYSGGGMIASLSVGLTGRFTLGVSYGGENIIGIGKINMNPQPCVQVKYLLFEEQNLSPALVIGFDSQGYGGYIKGLKRYAIKSKGFYTVLSKNTSFLGGLGLHICANISLETDDGDRDANFFAGCHKWLNPELCLLGEYDAAINDNSDNAIGSGKGYLNAGVRWSFSQRFFIEFSWKNILENQDQVFGSSREIRMIYVAHFNE